MDILRDICAGKPTGNEENIKVKLVVPLLELLGYDPIKEFDYERHVKSGRPDIVLLIEDKPVLIVEAKGLDKDLNEYKIQGLQYAAETGIPWVILTNGVQWDLYKTFIAGVGHADNEPVLTVLARELPSQFGELEDLVGRSDIKNIERKADKHVQLVSRKALVNDLARILHRHRTALFVDLRSQFAERYEKDEDFTKRVKQWTSEMGLDTNYDWFQVFKDDKKFRAYVLSILRQNGIRASTPREFEASYRKERHNEFTESVNKLLQREGIPLDLLDKLCFEGAYSLINRILFLRICEDRGFITRELTPELVEKLSEEDDSEVVVARLENLFASMRKSYPSVYRLPLLDHLEMSDIDWQGKAVSRLCGETLKYNFSDLGDVLGHLYQKHLDHNARRLIGQFYTHEEKVEFMLESLADWLHDGAKILDPACGSGSFLIGAHKAIFQQLLAKKYSTGTAHKHLLEDMLYGVDIDSFAAQLAAINLLVQNLDKPVGALQVFVGNSLVGYDTLARFGVGVPKREIHAPDPRQSAEVERDAKTILKPEAFDVIVGNPPFFRVGLKDEIYGKVLQTSEYGVIRPEGAEMNVATMFLKKAVDWLKPTVAFPKGRGGGAGLIMPKSLTYVDEYRLVREYLLNRCHIRKIVDLGRGWQDVGLEHIIIIFERKPQAEVDEIEPDVQVVYNVESLRRGMFDKHLVNESVFRNDPKHRFLMYVFGPSKAIRAKMKRIGMPLEEYRWTVWEGIRDDHEVTRFTNRQDQYSVPLLDGSAVRRWLTQPTQYVNTLDQRIPSGIKEKCRVKEKIVIKRVLSSKVRVEAVIDRDQSITHSSTTAVSFQDGTSLRYVTGVLDSRLMNLYVRDWLYNRTELTMNFREEYLGELPIPKMPEPGVKKRIEDAVMKLEQSYSPFSDGMKIPQTVTTPAQATKGELDEAVFDLYQLTPEEREFVIRTMTYSE